MAEDYGKDFDKTYALLQGENGEEIEVEELAVLEIDGELYHGFTDAVDENSDEEASQEFYILKEETVEDGDIDLVTIDSEEDLERIYNVFMEYFEAQENEKDS